MIKSRPRSTIKPNKLCRKANPNGFQNGPDFRNGKKAVDFWPSTFEFSIGQFQALHTFTMDHIDKKTNKNLHNDVSTAAIEKCAEKKRKLNHTAAGSPRPPSSRPCNDGVK